MTAIFISHRSSDITEAQELREWLGQQGHEQLFLDFDPADGIPAGVDWEQRLYQELRRCQALLIVLTPAWLESKWCGNELAIAREKGKAVFVVRVKACPGGPVIPAIQEVDLTPAGLEKLARGLKEHGLDPRDAFDWKPDRPIYPGLAAFDVDDAAIFFGRSEESWQSIEALRRLRLQAPGSPKLLLITGASGSGKSSLMRAGVLARLGKEPASWITARPFRRGADALGALAEALVWAFPPNRRPASLEGITARLAGPDGPGQLLTSARESRLALDRPEATLVLPLDQAEELLAAERGDDAAKLLDLLRETLAVVANEILVIATIRSDRLAGWQQHDSIKATAEHGELPFEMLPLGPMPMARIGEIVRGPAAYEGLHIDDDLVDAIRADTLTPDALPLLAYTLQYLHRHFAKDGRLTLAEYRSFGGLEGSVRSQADAAIPVEKLSEEDRRALQEAFVPGLVRATPQGGFSRSRALLATLPQRAGPYLRRLIDEARLLTTDSDPQRGVTVEVAHESLLRVWPTLVRWIAEDAESLRRLEAMQRAAHDWAQAGRGDDFLVHRDHRLADAEALIAEPRFAARLDNPDRDYIAACRKAQNQREADEKEAQERELRAARKLAHRRLLLIYGAIAALVAVAAVAWVAWWQWEEAQRQLELASRNQATGLWNDLDFAFEVHLEPADQNALWTLAVTGGLVREAFVEQLVPGTKRMTRFLTQPEAISRALRLSWPASQQAREAFASVIAAIETDRDQLVDVWEDGIRAVAVELGAQVALSPVLDVIERTRDPYLLWALTETVKELAGKLDAAQAQAALGAVLVAIEGTTNPFVFEDYQQMKQEEVRAWLLESLAEAVEALPVQLTVEQAQVALGPILDAIKGPADPGALAKAVKALAGKLDLAQAQVALGPVLDAIKETMEPSDLQALAEALHALPVQLTDEQAQAALGPILDAIKGEIWPHRLQALADALHALPVQLTDEQAQAAFGSFIAAIGDTSDNRLVDLVDLSEAVKALAVQLDPAQAQVALGSVLDAIKGETEPSRIQALAQVVGALPVQLTAEQAQAALGPILDAIKGADPSALDNLAQAVGALPVQLTAEQAQAVLGSVLDAINRTTDLGTRWALAEAVRALAGKLTVEQAQAALGPILDAIKGGEPEPLRLEALAEVAKALAGQLDSAQAQVALGSVLDAIKGETEPLRLKALAHAVRALPAQLTVEQAQAAFRSVIAAIENTSDNRLVDLSEAVSALAGKFDAAQAGAALGPVLDAIKGETEADQLKALAEAIKALGEKLDSAQAQAALGLVLDAIKGMPDAGMLAPRLYDPGARPALAEAVKALPVQLTAEQAKAALEIVRPGLAWASDSREAANWVGALVTVLPRANPEFSVAEIVEALKYPISAGSATDVLLEALDDIDPQSPGKEAGLAATLAWLTTAYPAIDLNKPPDCPQPLPEQQDVACPDSGA